MIELVLVGIGTGNPGDITLRAVGALNGADLVLIPRKGPEKDDLAALRRQICAQVLTDPVQVVEFDMPVRDASGDYLDGVRDWHDAIARIWSGLIEEHLPQGGRVALMVWGDPSLYDSSLRIAQRLRAARVTVIPGVTSLQLLTAAHAISLNTLGGPVLLTTGRRLREEGWAADVPTAVVMLDGACSFRSVAPEGVQIYWSAYLGLPQEISLSGPLAEISGEIVATRERARAAYGWIMDTYLMRRAGPD